MSRKHFSAKKEMPKSENLYFRLGKIRGPNSRIHGTNGRLVSFLSVIIYSTQMELLFLL